MNRPSENPRSPRARRLRRSLVRILAAALILSIGGAVTVGVLWKTGRFEPWLRARVVETYLREVAPLLPFQIEKLEVRKSWKALLAGNIEEISAVLKWGDWRARLSGPFRIRREGSTGKLHFQYEPLTTLEPAAPGTPAALRSPPFRLQAQVTWIGALSRIIAFELSAEEASFAWPLLGIAVETPVLSASWHEGLLGLTANWKSLNWSAIPPVPKDSRTIQLQSLALLATVPLQLQPFALEGEGHLSLKAEDSEALWDDLYLDLPLSKLPLESKLLFTRGKPLPTVDVTLGGGEKPPLSVKLAPGEDRLRLQWQSRPLPLPSLAAGALAAAPDLVKFLRAFVIDAGTLQSDGAFDIHLGADARVSNIRGKAELSKIDLRWPEMKLALRGASVKAPFSVAKGSEGEITIDALYFKKLKAKLGRTPFHFKPGKDGTWNFSLRSPTAKTPLPLIAENLPLRVGAIEGMVSASNYGFSTSLDLEPTDLAALGQAFCFNTKALPPAKVHAHFPGMEIASESISPEGQIQVDLLGGTVKLDAIGLFDLLSPVPEFDFNLEVNGIRLDRLGEWLGFGEMDGVLNLSARDVVFQSWFPTHYDFKVEVKPLNRWKVIFSPDAMKNFVRLFAGEDIDYLPGIAEWIAFGWPSRVLGGYDIVYAGIAASSAEGTTVIETLDPPAIVERYGKHFVLFGNRFRMPLRSPHYPLVVDATAMGNFVRHMSLQLAGLKKSRAGTEEKKNELPEIDCTPDDLRGTGHELRDGQR